METAMTTQASVTETTFHPRTIAHARALRFASFGRVARDLVARSFGWLNDLRIRFVLARRRRHDLAMLAEMDNRLLTDIGLTRGEVRAAARTPWWHEPVALADAARRRDEAMADVHRQATLRVVRTRPIAPGAGDIVRQERAAA
jgi:uncharacterized protein YjiS (DUF1127 family)